MRKPKPKMKPKTKQTPRSTTRSTSSEHHEHFRELLLATRKKNGLTQAVVAARLEKPQSFVAKVENGERRLDAVELVAYARAIDANPLAIMKKVIAEIEGE